MDGEAIEHAERAVLGNEYWEREFSVSHGEYLDIVRDAVSPSECTVCTAPDRAETYVNDMRYATSMFATALDLLAATTLSISDAVEVALALWRKQRVSEVSEAECARRLRAHMLVCGTRLWSTRLRLRAKKTEAMAALNDLLAFTEAIGQGVPSELAGEIARVIDGYCSVAENMSTALSTMTLTLPRPSVAVRAVEIAVVEPCIFCHGRANASDEAVRFVSNLRQRLDKVLEDEDCCRIDTLVNRIAAGVTMGAYQVMGTDAATLRRDVRRHVVHHDNTPWSLLFLLRCGLQILSVVASVDGPYAGDNQSVVISRRTAAKAAKAQGLYESVKRKIASACGGREVVPFGRAQIHGIDFAFPARVNGESG